MIHPSHAMTFSRHYSTAAAPASSGKASGECSDLLSGRPIDLHRFRAIFPDRWAAFLKAHFRSSAEVAYFFGVDDKCAWNWMAGVTAPRSEAVLALIERCPTVLPMLIECAA